MKRISALLSLALLALLLITPTTDARDAVGSSFGCFSTGRSLMKGTGLAGLGVGIGLGDNQRNTVVGSIHYGLYEYIEISGRAGLADADDVRLTFYGDFKYQFMDGGPELNDPFDLAIGGFFEYIKDVTQVGAQAMISKLYLMDRMQSLEPYARINVRVENVNSDSDIQFGLNGGLRWGVTRNISLFGELQLDGNDGLFLGLKDSIF